MMMNGERNVHGCPGSAGQHRFARNSQIVDRWNNIVGRLSNTIEILMETIRVRRLEIRGIKQ